MRRRRRSEILIKGSSELAQEMFREIEKNYEIKTIEDSHNALVMIKMRESAKNSLFYLGEVLVTEAKIQIDEKFGVGIVRGNKPEFAYWLAVIDAAYNLELEETKKWEEKLFEEEKAIKKLESEKEAEILKTKVNFETMKV
ncbi:alpha-D-ribose 1-methylphosphonate 5-triphosphate synthase subunit PhnG [Clostridium acidisoli DSM 12555]|uniref:Alpha-D-ribose 1-methylphosphonate 5-triphosphate synthase subunit PhnG n=1 Tax=Clostridium acidisoli DSM 12555 TaxID=1121291 RepID=A0A1W1XT44_9CLOT|nr:phosphonate C-P lyase system protein PhnG [Clostridium acidisoli]SMC27056.1 alpha-D-ribose 1-methylphosphonate 5-triphosphate synthase subunit PhnG [Clostridium acidisoli DSM 12555]